MTFKLPLKSTGLLVGVSLLAALLVACSGNNDSSKDAPTSHESHQVPTRVSLFHDGVRSLWEDHIVWTRLAIVSLAANLPDTEATIARLLQNQVDIGNAIKPYYGDAAGDQLTALLQDHIVIAAELVSAAKAGDNGAVAQAQARWYANADDIGAFLSSANPESWPQAEMNSMMREHLDLTLQEAVHYLTGNYQASVADYDEIHRQILHMADMLSDGIVSQFSERFATANAGR